MVRPFHPLTQALPLPARRVSVNCWGAARGKCDFTAGVPSSSVHESPRSTCLVTRETRAFSVKRRTLLAAVAAVASVVAFGVADARDSRKRVAILTMQMGLLPQDELRSAIAARFDLHFQKGKPEVRLFNAEMRDLRPKMALEAVAWRPDVIIAFGMNGTRTARDLSTDTPIVFLGVSDPVAVGFVESLSRPGGRLTGTSALSMDLLAKRLELLTALAPRHKPVAVLMALGTRPAAATELRAAATRLGTDVVEIILPDGADVDYVLRELTKAKARAALVVGWIGFPELARPAFDRFNSAGLPTAWPNADYVDQGGLVSVGPAGNEQLIRGVDMAAKILKGANPASIPVEQVTKVEVVLNLATARRLRLRVPNDILLRADRVVE